MRASVWILLSGLPFLNGCYMMQHVVENTAYEKRLYFTDQRLEERVEKDAKEMLQEVCNRHPHRDFTKDFREGFVDGYKDYLTYGGPIRPPAQAPKKYRTAKYLSPEGHCMVKDYFLGFQYGAECAQASGRRQFFTHLMTVAELPPPAPLDITLIPPPPEAAKAKPGLETAPTPMTVPMVTPNPIPGTPSPMTPPVAKPEVKPTPIPGTPSTTAPPMTIPKSMPAAPVPTPTPAPTPVPSSTPKLMHVPPLPVPMAPATLPVPAIPTSQPSSTVPTVPAVNPAPAIPLIPVLPTVSLSMSSPGDIVPATYTAPQR